MYMLCYWQKKSDWGWEMAIIWGVDLVLAVDLVWYVVYAAG